MNKTLEKVVEEVLSTSSYIFMTSNNARDLFDFKKLVSMIDSASSGAVTISCIGYRYSLYWCESKDVEATKGLMLLKNEEIPQEPQFSKGEYVVYSNESLYSIDSRIKTVLIVHDSV